MRNLPSILFLTILMTFAVIEVQAQDNLLGKIDFSNSGAAVAQADFVEGLKFLHNFEYADAARAFKRAREIDPDFAMAYYGEAKSHNHPLWFQQDKEAAMDVLNELGATVKERQSKACTQREKDILMSLEVLYGNTADSKGLTKEERDILYMETMKGLHEKYPNDHEITAFYGLSILGSAHEGREYAIYMRAAAELFDVWNENPEHPGAAHYLIHSFDDPVHAPLGLPMAKAYSEIAPSAAHAQHMTSHIFLALGMWDGVIDANIVARDVQTDRQKELNEQPTVCGHYPWWLEYGYLQQGDIKSAEEVLDACHERIMGKPNNSELWHFAVMRGHYVVDSENWKAAEVWSGKFDPNTRGAVNYYYTSALAALKQGKVSLAKKALDNLTQTPRSVERNIQTDQIKALLLMEEGKLSEGLSLLRKTAEVEADLPIDFGPPVIVKPSYELLGEVLSEVGKIIEANEAYEKQLERTPDRRRSLQGLNN
ncbi:tetratricopeptide repeat protein [Gracilimonas sp. Q87]|uniref:tetratricopeptide repeat protein n=1 Tax=Gracilimonas sp. Q87 TaxID=3384766 RepID=UPI003984232A